MSLVVQATPPESLVLLFLIQFIDDLEASPCNEGVLLFAPRQLKFILMHGLVSVRI